jgi:hypothetical protein
MPASFTGRTAASFRRRPPMRPDTAAASEGEVAVIPVICPLPPIIVRTMARRLDPRGDH